MLLHFLVKIGLHNGKIEFFVRYNIQYQTKILTLLSDAVCLTRVESAVNS